MAHPGAYNYPAPVMARFYQGSPTASFARSDAKGDGPLQPIVDLLVLGKNVRVRCPDAGFAAWIRNLYRCMEQPAEGTSDADLDYRITTSSDPEGFLLAEAGEPCESAPTAGDILAQMENALTIALQLQRPDLLFVHAAALADADGAIVLVGPSGAGKSTLAWALTRHGFAYLSDELAPFDPGDAAVVPFPRAIHLKIPPPGVSELHEDTVDTGAALCVPAESLPGGVADAPRRLHSLIFLAPSPRPAQPEIRELTSGDAVSRLFANTLNALAHPAYGVDSAVRIARQARCYELAASDLDATCELIVDQTCSGSASGVSCQ